MTNPIYTQIAMERSRQEELKRSGKFLWTCASSGVSYEKKLAVLGEEFGEVSNLVVEHGIATDKYAADPSLQSMPAHRQDHFRKELIKELIQVVAVCVAWVEALDSEGERLENGATLPEQGP
jgi:hypothetical protein